jgi:hypothetical protein
MSASPFLRARLGALYLLSLTAVLSALLAWKPAWREGPVRRAIPAVVLALAALGGQAAHERLALLSDRAGRGRFRALGAAVHAAVALIAFLSLFTRQADVAQGAVRALVVLQPLFLLLAGLGRGQQGTLLNAVLLTVFAALAGGPVAATAVVACAVLVPLFLAADHHARLLLDYPVREAPGPGLLLRDAVPPVLGIGALLACFFYWRPPAAFVAFADVLPAARIEPGVLVRLLLELFGIAALAGVGFYLLLRWSGGAGGAGAELEGPAVEARRRPVPAPADGGTSKEPPLGGIRERVVRVYVRALERLARSGRRRKPSQTPAEFARGLEPADAAARLTELFTRARYGNEELGEADLAAAEGAAEALTSS